MEIWNKCVSPGASSSAASFSSLAGMLSGPAALSGFISFSSFRTPFRMLTLMGGILGVLLGPRSRRSDISSFVKTEQNWSPIMFDLFTLSEPFFFKGATPVWYFLRNLMKFQYDLFTNIA